MIGNVVTCYAENCVSVYVLKEIRFHMPSAYNPLSSSLPGAAHIIPYVSPSCLPSPTLSAPASKETFLTGTFYLENIVACIVFLKT